MNTTIPASKNRRRKDRRAQYHRLSDMLSRTPNDPNALAELAELKRRFFSQVDLQLESLDTEKAERRFAREIARQMLREGPSTGWVVVTGSNGRTSQIRANLHEYVEDRLRLPELPRSGDERRETRADGLAIQQALDRAVAMIRPQAIRRRKVT